MKFLFLVGLTLMAAFGCSNNDESTAALTGYGDHYEANHCEVFVDKVVNASSSHAYKNTHIYLKTLNDRLDSSIESVGIRYRAVDVSAWCDLNPGSGSCEGLGEWQEREAKAFMSDDYHRYNLFIGADYAPTLEYEAVFFVRTTAGTTYWAKDNGKNFSFSVTKFENIGEAYRQQGLPYTTYGTYELADQPKTADFFSELNPKQCR